MTIEAPNGTVFRNGGSEILREQLLLSPYYEALKVADEALTPFAEDYQRWLNEDPEYQGREFTIGELSVAIRARAVIRAVLARAERETSTQTEAP